MSIGCLSILSSPEHPACSRPSCRGPSAGFQRALYTAPQRMNLPSSPLKKESNLPLLPCAPQCCSGSTSSMWWPILRPARLSSCKRTWTPHHSAIPSGPILPLYFSASHFLFLFHFCPLFSLQASLSEILQWDHGGDGWACDSSGILWKPPQFPGPVRPENLGHHSPSQFSIWQAAQHADISPSGLFSSLHLVCSHTPILFRAASSWSSFIARKDLCWWFKPDAVLVWPFL